MIVLREFDQKVSECQIFYQLVSSDTKITDKSLIKGLEL